MFTCTSCEVSMDVGSSVQVAELQGWGSLGTVTAAVNTGFHSQGKRDAVKKLKKGTLKIYTNLNV